MRHSAMENKYVFCVKNDDYPTSLELRKVYRVVSDTKAAEHQYIRVIDESGEDYLFPRDYFVSIRLPSAAEKVFTSAT